MPMVVPWHAGVFRIFAVVALCVPEVSDRFERQLTPKIVPNGGDKGAQLSRWHEQTTPWGGSIDAIVGPGYTGLLPRGLPASYFCAIHAPSRSFEVALCYYSHSSSTARALVPY